LSALLKRLARLFYAPSGVMEELKENPRWLGALLVGALLVVVSSALVPEELMRETMRLEAIRRGGEVPTGMEGRIGLMRNLSLIATPIFWFVWNTFVAGVLTVIFAFLLGDEGTYRQYLSVVVHASFIGAVGAVLTTPLRIQAQDLYLTLSIGTFAQGFMAEGYWLRVLQTLDLFGLWAYGLMAVGAGAIDKRRTWLSGFIAIMVFGFSVALLVARIRG
jgi:hypothetical protein